MTKIHLGQGRTMRGPARAYSCRSLRAQVAAEYLATYGWALFAMFAVIAILVSSGMLSSGRFTSESCTFAPNLPCISFYAAKSTTQQGDIVFNFKITNTQGFPMVLTNCALNLSGGSYYSSVACSGGGSLIKQGDFRSFSVPLTSSSKLVPNEIRRLNVVLTFKNCQDALSTTPGTECLGDDVRFPPHNTSGQLIVQVRG